MDENERYFFRHAGYSYATGEAPGKARAANAQALAACEAWAKRHLSFVWEVDTESTSTDFDDVYPGHYVWVLKVFADGVFMSALGAVDFGPDGEPEDAPDRRVFEAEMAREIMNDDPAERY